MTSHLLGHLFHSHSWFCVCGSCTFSLGSSGFPVLLIPHEAQNHMLWCPWISFRVRVGTRSSYLLHVLPGLGSRPAIIMEDRQVDRFSCPLAYITWYLCLQHFTDCLHDSLFHVEDPVPLGGLSRADSGGGSHGSRCTRPCARFVR